jgi:hypothetical protein
VSDVWITWRIEQPGAVNGVYSQKRGDHQLLPAAQAKSMVAQGLADYGRVSLEKLGLSYKTDEKLLNEVLQAYARPHVDDEAVRPIGRQGIVYQ